MALSVDVCDLAARFLARLDEARDFYLHTRQAWRVVQQIAHENRSVGIVDTATGQEVLAPDLEPMAQRVVHDLAYRRPDQLELQDTDQGSSDVESRRNDPSHRETDKWA